VEVTARFHREEADAVRKVREYEAVELDKEDA
jgi:hypothetical protein